MANYPAGVYGLLITGTVGTKFDSFVLSITLVDPCSTAQITLLDSPIVDDTYSLRDVDQSQPWDYANVLTIDTQVDCGLISVDFFNEDGSDSALDTSLFSDVRDANIFTVIYTEDVLKKGTYPISYKAYYSSYPGNFEEKRTAFTVTIIDPCDAP